MVKRILGVSLAAVMSLSSVIPTFAVTPANGLMPATGEYANSTGSIVADKDAVDINGVVGKDSTQGKYSQYDVILDGDNNTTIDPFTNETEVYATVLPAFTARIPKVLVLSAAGECDFAVSVKGDISGAQTVLIKPEAAQFDMVEVDPLTGNPIGKKDNVPATIEVEDIDWTYATDFKTNGYTTYVDHPGFISADCLTAGSWRGTFNFLIGLNSLGNNNTPDTPDDGDPVTDYTVEEIEADETLFMIGATKPEYVVADFNDDFTEVVITKNGEDSDGVMAALLNKEAEDIESLFTSPMTIHSDTLTNAIVKDGVVNVGSGAFINLKNFITIIENENASSLAPFIDSILNQTLSVSLSSSIQSIDANAFTASSLKTINLPEGLERIEFGAFQSSSVRNIILPESLTYLGGQAFYQSGLRSIAVPKSVKNIENYTFASCWFLEYADLQYVETFVSEQYDNYTFEGCISLKTLNLSQEAKFINTLGGSTSETEHWGNNMDFTREDLEDGSIIFYKEQDNGEKIIAGAYLQSGTEYVVPSDISYINDIYCEENVKLHVHRNVAFNKDNYSRVDVLFGTNIIEQNIAPYPLAINLTIYGAAGSEAEEIANTYGHTFIAE